MLQWQDRPQRAVRMFGVQIARQTPEGPQGLQEVPCALVKSRGERRGPRQGQGRNILPETKEKPKQHRLTFASSGWWAQKASLVSTFPYLIEE